MKLSPREIRVGRALLERPIMRENLDSIAGCSNGPELVAGLRRKGLDVPCERKHGYDKDGKLCRPGQYRFTAKDKQKFRKWLGA